MTADKNNWLVEDGMEGMYILMYCIGIEKSGV